MQPNTATSPNPKRSSNHGIGSKEIDSSIVSYKDNHTRTGLHHPPGRDEKQGIPFSPFSRQSGNLRNGDVLYPILSCQPLRERWDVYNENTLLGPTRGLQAHTQETSGPAEEAGSL